MSEMSRMWDKPVFAHGRFADIDLLTGLLPNWNGEWEPASIEHAVARFERVTREKTASLNVKLGGDEKVYGAMLWLDEQSFQRYEQIEMAYGECRARRVVINGKETGKVAGFIYCAALTSRTLRPDPKEYVRTLRALLDAEAPVDYVQRLIQETAPRWIGEHYLLGQEFQSLSVERKQLNEQQREQLEKSFRASDNS